MISILDKIIDSIRVRSREEWQELFVDNLNQTRIWLQENGELAFLAGMLLCFLLVTFIKFFSGLIALTVLTAITVYQIALPESEMDSRDSASGENGSVHEHSESSSDKESEDSSLTH